MTSTAYPAPIPSSDASRMTSSSTAYPIPSPIPSPSPTPPSPSPSPSRSHFSPTNPSNPSNYTHQPYTHFSPNSYSPTKPPQTRPNAHPYAIKTTSTALLSRSTSSSAMSSAAVHRYVPASPTAEGGSPVKVIVKVGEHRGSRHRYSRSLTGEGGPPALPPPPPQVQAQGNGQGNGGGGGKGHRGHSHSISTPGSGSGYDRSEDEEEDDTPRRRKLQQRAESVPLFPGSLVFPSAQGNAVLPDLNLPEDPKTWTPAQVGVYLASRSVSQAQGEMPVEGLGDVVAFVQEKQVGGRAFMRLAEGDLGSLPPAQRASILATSRALRQRTMRSRIFGPSSGSHSATNSGSGLEHPASPFTDEPQAEDLNAPLPIGGLTTANITRRNGNGMHIRPRRRSRHSSLASDSSEGSAGSFSSNASGAGGRVRGMVDEFESRMDEEGAGVGDSGYYASNSGTSPVDERRGSRSPVKRRGDGGYFARQGAQGQGAPALASPTPTKVPAQQQQQHRLPQRPAVTDLFSFSATDSSPPQAAEQGLGLGPGGTQLPPSPPAPTSSTAPTTTTATATTASKDGQVDLEEEKDSTITGLARKNVNGREARLLPFPPTQQQGQGQGGWVTPMHTGTQYALPSSPDPALSHSPFAAQAYAHGPHPFQAQGHPQHQHQHAYTHPPPPPPADYELGFRHATSPSHLAASSPAAGAGATSPHPADPYSQTYIVQHNPSPTGSSGGGSTAKAKAGKQRLLPYPPVVGQSVLYHPRPRRLVGVGGGEGESTGVEADEESEGVYASAASDAETTTETEAETGTETDAWETANEGVSSTSASEAEAERASSVGTNDEKEKWDWEEGEDEPTMEQLLQSGQPTPVPAHITGAEAWEMELGETVKRISGSAAASASASSFDSASHSSFRSNSYSASHSHSNSSSSVHLQSNAHFGTNGRHSHTHNHNHTGTTGTRTSARDVSEIGRKAGRAGAGAGGGGTNRGSVAGTNREKAGTKRAGLLGLFEPPPSENPIEDGVEDDRPPAVPEKDEPQGAPRLDLDLEESSAAAQASLDARESSLAQREKALQSREEALGLREAQVNETNEKLVEKDADLASLQSTLQAQESLLATRETDLASRAQTLDAREAELGQREAFLAQREVELRGREEALREREEAVQEQERVLGEMKAQVESERVRVREAREEVERREREVTLREAEVAKAQAKAKDVVDREVGPAEEEGVRESGEGMGQIGEDINPSRPKPYLASPWSIKRDYVLGRFIGLFPFPFALFGGRAESAGDTSTSSTGNVNANANDTTAQRRPPTPNRGSVLHLLSSNLSWRSLTALAGQGGGYVVLMSIGVCVVVLRAVLGRRGLGLGGAGVRR